MTGTNTIALISATGLVGSAIFKVLAALHTENKLKLIVVHRASSKLPSLPKGVESRPLDLNEPTKETVHAALADADLVINASGHTTLAADLVFLDHLATLPSLKRYIPSYFAINYSPSEIAANTSDILKNKLVANDRARTLNIPLTLVGNGLFEPFLTFAAFTGIDVANATLSLYSDADERKLQVTSIPYLASAVGELALKDPAALQPSYTVFEYAASGYEIAKAIEQATGRKVEIKQVTDADIEGGRKADDLAALASTVKVKWGKGEFQAEDAYNPAEERKTLALTIKEAADAAK